MFKVYEVHVLEGVAEVVAWFADEMEAEEWADSQDYGDVQYVVYDEDEDFYFL